MAFIDPKVLNLVHITLTRGNGDEPAVLHMNKKGHIKVSNRTSCWPTFDRQVDPSCLFRIEPWNQNQLEMTDLNALDGRISFIRTSEGEYWIKKSKGGMIKVATSNEGKTWFQIEVVPREKTVKLFFQDENNHPLPIGT